MAGINIAESCHVVNVISAADVNAGATGRVIDMKNYDHCTFIFNMGATDANPFDVTIEEDSDSAFGTHNEIIFSYYREDTDAGDVFDSGPTAVVAATGIDHTVILGTDNTMILIEVPAASLTDGCRYLRLKLAAGAGNTFASVTAILSGPRYAGYGSPTVIP